MLTQGVRTTLKGHELILRGFGEQLIAHDILDDPENGRHFIENMKRIDPGMAGFGIARPDGQLILVSTIKPGQPLPNLATNPDSRDSFKEALEAKQLRTGRPYYFKPLGTWVLPIRTPIYDKTGKVLAVAAAAYKMERGSVAWTNSELPSGTVLALMRDDGHLIFRQPLYKSKIGEQYEKTYGTPVEPIVMQQVLQLNKQKSFRKISVPRNKESELYLSYNYIPEYALHTGVLISQQAVIYSWLQRLIIPTLLFAIFLLGGTWAFLRANQRQNKTDDEISQLTAWQEAVFNSANYAIISTDPKGTIVSFNSAAEHMLGYTADEVIGKVTPAIIHDKNEVRQRALELSEEYGRSIEPGFEALSIKALHGEVDEHEWTYVRKDGSKCLVILSITPLYGTQQEIIGFLGIAADLSEKNEIQANLYASETRYAALFESASDAIFLMHDGIFVDCNPATLKIFECSRDEIIGCTPQRFSPEFQADGRPSSEKALEKINAALNGDHPVFEWRHQKLDGTLFDAEVSLNIVEISNQPHLLATVRDITERKQFEDKLLFQSRHDSLTGLANRVCLHESFYENVENLNYENEYTVLMLLDLDRFKEINDTLGHHIGDEVLKLIGPRLNQICIANNAIVARLGGDEFAILANMPQSLDEITNVANSCVKALQEPFTIHGINVSIGASIGIACYPQHGDDSHELLRAADVAMYQAKKLSMGAILYDNEYDEYSTQRLGFANELKHAVEEKQLILHYQPKIAIDTGKTIGLEALVRWKHPTQGLLYPDAFIGLVEMSEIIHPFTQAVIELAVSDKKKLHKLGYPQPVAINLSARNLFDDNCFNALESALSNYQLSHSEIELELTESAVMHDPERAIENLNKFKEKGIDISIDDFGTGYSSLAYLRRLPVAALKIDRTFVMEMTKNSQDKAIIQSTIALAHSLNLKVIAEGVENNETLQLLENIECDIAQGYGICRPQPIEKLIEWLSENNSK